MDKDGKHGTCEVRFKSKMSNKCRIPNTFSCVCLCFFEKEQAQSRVSGEEILLGLIERWIIRFEQYPENMGPASTNLKILDD
jgi:hypothetical protein